MSSATARLRASSGPSPSRSSARSSCASSCARSRATGVADLTTAGPAVANNPDLAGEVVRICREVLGDALIGAYLHGSSVRGSLRPTSDLDILAIVRRETTAEERRAIVQRLLVISGPAATRGPARPVELTIVRQAEVRPWRPGPVVDLVYGEWLRPAFEKGDIPEPRSMPDLAPEISLVLAGNRALFGPPPAEVLDPVPSADLRRSIVAGVPSLLSDLSRDQRNVLLTLARIVATLETNEILPKEEAAELTAHRLPPGANRDILLAARQMYIDGISDEQAGADWNNLRPVALEAATALISEIASFDIG